MLAGVASLLFAVPALGCRCAPVTLERYFEQAELVMIARATATRVVGESPGHLEVAFAPVEPPYKGDPKAAGAFVTNLSSASCGVPVESGQTFLLFATRDESNGRTMRFDTCNGTRRFGPGVDVSPFEDTPADKIVLRLQSLRVAHAMQHPDAKAGGPRLPKTGHPGAELIGLLELPGASALVVRTAPDDGAALVARVRSARDVVTRESGDEKKAAVVVEARGDWYRIALPGERSGWVKAGDAGPLRRLPELVVNRLSYLTEHWDGWIWPEPGAGHPVDVNVRQREGRHEYPATVLEAQDIGGTLWLRVDLLSASPCDGGSPTTVAGGWVPAYSPDGKLTTWFHARGC